MRPRVKLPKADVDLMVREVKEEWHERELKLGEGLCIRISGDTVVLCLETDRAEVYRWERDA